MTKPSKFVLRKSFLSSAVAVLICMVAFTSSGAAEPEWNNPGFYRVSGKEQSRMSSAQAANIAKERYGGKVLKVSKRGNDYQVRLLLPSGTVKNVTVNSRSDTNR